MNIKPWKGEDVEREVTSRDSSLYYYAMYCTS